jgi:hypothetical protein
MYYRVKSLMMEAARTSETSVHNYFTWQYIPGDNSELQRLMIVTAAGTHIYHSALKI